MKQIGSLFTVGKPQIYHIANKGVIMTIGYACESCLKEFETEREEEIIEEAV